MVDGIVTALAESYEENNCRLVLSYEDDAGNVTETKQEFTMTVTQPADDMVMEDDFPVMDEEEPGGHTGLIIALIVGVGIGMFSALHQYSAFDYVFMVLVVLFFTLSYMSNKTVKADQLF